MKFQYLYINSDNSKNFKCMHYYFYHYIATSGILNILTSCVLVRTHIHAKYYEHAHTRTVHIEHIHGLSFYESVFVLGASRFVNTVKEATEWVLMHGWVAVCQLVFRVTSHWKNCLRGALKILYIACIGTKLVHSLEKRQHSKYIKISSFRLVFVTINIFLIYCNLYGKKYSERYSKMRIF